MEPRYLVIGASGFIGARLYARLGPQNAIATYASRNVSRGIPFDAASMRLADTVLERHSGLTHAFILYGVTAIDACARDPEATGRINVTSTRFVIDDLVRYCVKPVFASSDAVFDGTRGLWTEEDPVNPILTYGRQKLEVERHLMERATESLVLRLPKVVSTVPGANDVLEDWLNKIERREIIRCARDQVFSPVGVDDAVDAFIRLAESAQAGIFHACGPRPVTRLEWLQMLVEEASCYRMLAPRIVSCSIRDFEFAEPRPLDTSMSPSKLYSVLGCSFDDPRELCRKAAARYRNSAEPRGAGRARVS